MEFSYCTHWKKVTVQPTHKERKLCSTSSGVEYLHKSFEFLLHKRFVYALFIQSFIYIHVDLQTFTLDFVFWFITQYSLTHFVAEIVPALAIGTSFSCLLYTFVIIVGFCSFVLFLSTFILYSLHDAPGSFCIDLVPTLESAIFLRSTSSFIGEWY